MGEKAFAIMPLDSASTSIYTSAIKRAAIQAGFECSKAEAVEHTTSMRKNAVEGIEQTDIVIADLSEKNADVHYALGIAHLMGRPTVMITRSLADVPDDLKPYRVTLYENSIEGVSNLQDQLSYTFDLFRRGGLITGNPVHDNMTDSIFSSVVRTRDVLQYERNAQRKVCVLAPDIALGPGVFKDAMIDNLTRGVVYQYIVPNTRAMIAQLNDFVDSLELGDRRSGFKCRTVDPLYIESDVTIIDPNTTSEYGFILAPAEKADYHYRVTGGSFVRVKKRFEDLWYTGQEVL